MQKIRQIIGQYGEDNFCIAFSGGKDSTVLSKIVDMALPENKIPRVFADTGIELNLIREFVNEMQKKDSRVVIIKPSTPIKLMLEEKGYPFKSKFHSKLVERYQRLGRVQSIENYLGTEKADKDWYEKCPKVLQYQFTEECNLKISDKCCEELKEKPMQKWQEEHSRPYLITGVMKSEGGRRAMTQCLFIYKGKLKKFNPLSPMDEEWEKWFIEKYNVEICAIYYPPYNFTRTGCKGCGFALHLQDELDTLERFFPKERVQCEIIWKPLYEEYRRLGYRLTPSEMNGQMNLFGE